MPIFRPTPAMLHLSNYWNALNRNAPPDELARLAALVDPSDIATIERAVALHAWRMPDPAFATRLETTLMNAYPTTVQVTVPLVTAQQPASNGRYAPSPARPIARHWPQSRRRWSFSSLLGVALVVLLILASLGGIWLTYERHNNSHILAPPDATPATEASPDVPMYRGNPARTGVFPGPGIAGDPVEVWRLEFEGSVKSAPALANGVLYVGVDDGTIRALDATSGDAIWTFTASSVVTSSGLAVIDGIVYAGSEDGMLYALDAADGSEVWTFPGAQADASVAVVDGVVYTGSADGVLHALDAAIGTELWQAPLGDTASRSPAVADGVVYMASAGGILHTFDATTGQPGWSFQTEGGGTLVTTAVADGVVYQMTNHSSDQSYAYALNAATGEVIWQVPAADGKGFLPPAIGNGRIFIPSTDNQVYALDAATGEPIWQFQTGARVEAAPALVGDTLYVAGVDGYLYALDGEHGTEYWRHTIEGGSSYGPIVSGGVAYVGTYAGYLYAIGGTERVTLAFPAEDAATPVATPAVEPASVVASPAATGELATFLWATTGGPEPLDRSADLAIAPDGNIWVVDGGNSRFQIFSPAGDFIESWGTAGDGEGEFNFIRPNSEGDAFGAVAFAPDGTFYVADTGNFRVQHFSADRTFLHTWGAFGGQDSEFLSPFDIVIDSQGNVFVNDDRRNDIQKFTADGAHLLTFGGVGSEPGQLDFQCWLTIDAEDNIWVAEGRNQRVQQFSNDGQFLALFDGDGTFEEPYSVAIDARGQIFVVDLGRFLIVVLAPDGTVIGEWGAPEGIQLQEFANIVLDGEGNAYALSYLDGTLLKFQLNPPLADGSAPDSVATPVATPAT